MTTEIKEGDSLSEELKQIWFGANEEHTEILYQRETEHQLEDLKKFEIDVSFDDGKRYSNGQEISNFVETLFNSIIEDRKVRINNLMADRPPIAICTLHDDKIIRLEYYAGHDDLEKVYDLHNANWIFAEDSYSE